MLRDRSGRVCAVVLLLELDGLFGAAGDLGERQALVRSTREISDQAGQQALVGYGLAVRALTAGAVTLLHERGRIDLRPGVPGRDRRAVRIFFTDAARDSVLGIPIFVLVVVGVVAIGSLIQRLCPAGK